MHSLVDFSIVLIVCGGAFSHYILYRVSGNNKSVAVVFTMAEDGSMNNNDLWSSALWAGVNNVNWESLANSMPMPGPFGVMDGIGMEQPYGRSLSLGESFLILSFTSGAVTAFPGRRPGMVATSESRACQLPPLREDIWPHQQSSRNPPTTPTISKQRDIITTATTDLKLSWLLQDMSNYHPFGLADLFVHPAANAVANEHRCHECLLLGTLCHEEHLRSTVPFDWPTETRPRE